VSAARKWLYVVGMQGAWFAAALTASTPWHPVGVLANLGVFVVHAATSGNGRREVVRGGLALGLGLLLELVHQYAGGLRVQQAGVLPPAWLLSLWPVFAAAMMTGHPLAWARPRKALAAVLGAVVGPLSYSGGGRLGALELDGMRSVIALSLCWAVAMPTLAWLADWLEPAAPAPEGTPRG
jgi:hypothetical protein